MAEEKKSKILIVEDDLDVADMLNAYFRVQGYDVITVNWGEDGVRAAQTTTPDLMILDIRLPDIDGYEVAKRIRSTRKTQEIPIIFLTEKRDRADRLHGLELGADDYITKPFDVQELRLRVRNSLLRSSTDSLTNAVTSLPDGPLVDEKLKEYLENKNSALILIGLLNVDAFREAYGFVASDDVLRAVSLMLQNAIRELGTKDDFVGHFAATDFLLAISPANLPAFEERIRSRLEQSLDYFYPIKDREAAAQQKDRLAVRVAKLNSGEGNAVTVEEFRQDLAKRIKS